MIHRLKEGGNLRKLIETLNNLKVQSQNIMFLLNRHTHVYTKDIHLNISKSCLPFTDGIHEGAWVTAEHLSLPSPHS